MKSTQTTILTNSVSVLLEGTNLSRHCPVKGILRAKFTYSMHFVHVEKCHERNLLLGLFCCPIKIYLFLKMLNKITSNFSF